MRKIIGITWMLVFAWIGGKTQDYPHPRAEWDFVQYAQNRLIFPGDSAAFHKFYRKLDNLIFKGEGKINILHIGGSHVQADIFSGRVRERLTNLFPGNKGSRGLLFPYEVAGTNNPYNYYVSHTGKWEYCRNIKKDFTCPLGLTGMAVYTADTVSSISITLKQENYPAYDFNRIRIFHKADPHHFSISIANLDTSRYAITEDTLRGISEIFLLDYLASVELKFTKTDSAQRQIMILGIQLENTDPGVTYHAIGVNGAATGSFLKCTLLEDHLGEVQPDLVIFGLGINDAAGSAFEPSYFEYNYRQLIQKVKNVNPDCAILFITNNDSFKKYRRKYYVNKNGPIVRESMLKVAGETGSGVWDLFSVMGGLSSMKTWELNGLAKKDKIHFTTSGYNLIGDMMFSAIVKSYESYLRNQYSTIKD